MKQKYEEFRKKCYEKYQLNWMLSHGYSLQDLIDAMNEKYIEDDSREYTTPGCYYEDVLDNDGFHGELFHYYDAFLEKEYLDGKYMSKQTMTIEELIKAGKMESSVEFPLKRYVVVNIGFFNNEDAEEETQLTLGHDPLTKEGIKELKELFTSLANEFDTKPNRVTYIHIVVTAQTDKELKAMGY